ncbi:MAG: hypothetical protein OXQ28_01565 [Acidobacteriota bacterium]|nr:hypothetical protein [Acidobacteriota bacterium]
MGNTPRVGFGPLRGSAMAYLGRNPLPLGKRTMNSIVAVLAMPLAGAAERCVWFGPGHTFEAARADLSGVRFPTRCDGLLYRDPDSGPLHPAGTDPTPRTKSDRAFDFDRGATATVAAGLERGRLRREVEFAHGAHGSASAMTGTCGGMSAFVRTVRPSRAGTASSRPRRSRMGTGFLFAFP